MYKDIDDYGLIGNMHSIALVSNDGSIDYCSMPHIDSPTLFAAILDDEKGGLFKIQPEDKFKVRQSYIKDTNILTSRFKTDRGDAELIDFMPVNNEDMDYMIDNNNHIIHRCLKMDSGRIDFRLEFSPRPQYASEIPEIKKDGNIFKVTGKKDRFALRVGIDSFQTVEERVGSIVIRFSLREGQAAHFDFIYGDIDLSKSLTEAETCSFKETERFWLNWINSCIGGKCKFWGEYTEMINRSLLVLKLLTFQPTGAISAAATTSLPEAIGGERNWDYRFSWIRDASFTLKAMLSLGHISEADIFIRWLHKTYKRYGSDNLQIMYSLEGKDRLKEEILDYLKGYKNSRPVRAGNEAYSQKQWDIYGEIMDTAMRLSDYAGQIDEELWPFFRSVCNLALKDWQMPDDGIWEVRNGPFHFVYSKVMCWVALDRGIKIAKRYGFDAPVDEWQREADKIKVEVIEKGYDKDIKSFVQYYGSKEIDSSLLLLPLVGFLPFKDRYIQNTIDTCKRHLMNNGFLLRYSGPDGLKGEEGAFLLCNFWLIECLAMSDRMNEARRLLDTTVSSANHLGLFSEEFDFKTKTMLGNFPQAFSHIGYINAAITILSLQNRDFHKEMDTPSLLLKRMQKLIPLKIVLNKTDRKYSDTTKEIAANLKLSLNNLQGAFFNVLDSSVNYQAMRKSESYQNYSELAFKLNSFDPFSINREEEKKAFWLNIYNILIIHGVIELDIKGSVKEVFNFFSRVGYMIGGLYFTPDDIEHGILRSNMPRSGSGIKQFSQSDKRLGLCLTKLDPRIHFALVCASNSCPPIAFYNADNIERQLDIAGRSFVNREGLTLDKDKNILYLSQIFKWYGLDFGSNQKEILAFVLNFAEDKIREYILENTERIKILYLPYNWDLNKRLE